MRKTDGRKLSHESLEEIRIRSVRQIEKGESPEILAKTLGFSPRAVYNWIAKYREGGIDALRAKRVPGRPPKLSGRDVQWLVRTITDKTPLQLRLPFALWTREIIRDLIRDRCGVKLSGVSVGRLLKKLGFSPQRPLRRAYEQDRAAARAWVQHEYPAIRELAREAHATIYFADEAGVRTDFHSGTTWAPVGVTPTVPAMGRRESVNMISAISPRGKLRFMIVQGKMTAAKFIVFLKRLTHGATNPIFLIVDGHSIHRSAQVRRFVELLAGRLRLFYLPPYSPELNPDELVWNDVKNNGVGRRSLRRPGDLKRAVIRHLKCLQASAARVRAFFRESHVRYAA